MKVGPTATKKSVLEELLEQGMVLVALDARVEGVEVPSHLHRDPQLRLNLSYRFGLPMDVGEWGVSATLTFAGVPFECRIPWRAIFLLVSHVSGQPYLFPDDIPAELLSSGEGAEGLQRATKLEPARPKLTLVTRDPAADEDDGAAETGAVEPRVADTDVTDADVADTDVAESEGVEVVVVAAEDTDPADAEPTHDADTEAAEAAEVRSRPAEAPARSVEPAPAPALAETPSSYVPATPSDVEVPVVDSDAPKHPRRPRGRGHLRLVK